MTHHETHGKNCICHSCQPDATGLRINYQRSASTGNEIARKAIVNAMAHERETREDN